MSPQQPLSPPCIKPLSPPCIKPLSLPCIKPLSLPYIKPLSLLCILYLHFLQKAKKNAPPCGRGEKA